MKQKVVPTSPKSDVTKPTTPKVVRRSLHWMLVLGVLIASGTVSGMFGFVIASHIPTNWPLLGSLNVVAALRANQASVSSQSTRIVVSDSNQSVPDVVGQLALVTAVPAALDDALTVFATATRLTSDGWMVVPTSALPAAESTRFQLLFADGATAGVAHRIDDSLLGVSFIQATVVATAAVVDFSSSTQFTPGQSVMTITPTGGSQFTVNTQTVAAASPAAARLRQSTVIYPSTVQASGGIANGGQPAFVRNGQFAGLVLADQRIIPAAAINSSLQGVISSAAITHSTLELGYINTAFLTVDERAAANVPTSGILIRSVLDSHGSDIQPGDVITAIQNTAVDATTDLAMIIHTNSTSRSIVMDLWRDDKIMSLQVEL